MDDETLNEFNDMDYNEVMNSRNTPLTNSQPQQKEDRKQEAKEKDNKSTYYDLHDYIT